MARGEISLQNFAGGEYAPEIRARWNLPVYVNGCELLRNFIPLTQGPARFRPGFRYVIHTRRNNIACLLKFQFSNQQSYVLEFTDGYMRVHKDSGVVTETAKNITGATAANPCVITSNSHSFSNGDEVYISGVVGMTELNGKFFIVAGVAANTFQLTDQDGNNVNSSAFTAYSSGGTVARVYEITTPYREADDLFSLKVAQNADTMYVVHPYYEPRKLTRSGHTSWTLALFTRTQDPFLTKKTITGATAANPCVITSVAHGLSNGDIVIIEGIVGMTQLNSRYYTIANVAADTFELFGVNSSAYTAYSSGGYASKRNLLPGAVTFFESRTVYSVISSAPLAYKASRSPDNAGAARYDDFTNGTDDDHAIEHTINAEDESAIQWIRGNDKFLAVGGFNGIFRVTGDTDEAAISPTSVKVRRVTSVGASSINPLSLENAIIYAEQNNLTARGFVFDVIQDTFVAKDLNLLASHVTKGLLKQFTWQSGRPDIAWAVKSNGELIGLTYKASEDVNGWHKHPTRTGDEFISICSVPRTSNYERLWAAIQREVDGVTRRYIEYLEDWADIPEFEDYFTAPENEDTDRVTWLRAMAEAQKYAIHYDSAVTYNGSDTSIASTTMTPAAVSGNDIIFTAGASIFKASDVDRQIWKKAIDGEGYGRAKIVEYISATQVRCDIKENFDSVTAMAAGDWFFTVGVIYFDHLEGETVKIITDGAAHPEAVVENGAVTLNYQASVVCVGLGYTGILKTMNLEVGGITGPAQTKQKNVYRVGIKFHQTLGPKFGTSLYKLEAINFRSGRDAMDRPVPLYSGEQLVSYSDGWEGDKHIVIVQQVGTPCEIQLIQPYVLTSNK